MENTGESAKPDIKEIDIKMLPNETIMIICKTLTLSNGDHCLQICEPNIFYIP